MNTTYTNILDTKNLGILHRLAIASALHQNDSITTISKELNFSRQTIHKEINRGTVTHRKTQLIDTLVYDPYAGQMQYDNALSKRGPTK